MERDGLTNVEIMTFLSGRKGMKNFNGVFASDNIPNALLSLSSFSIICNLSRLNEEGTHFITIVYKRGVVLYLDSLNLQFTINDDIVKFVTSLNPISTFQIGRGIQNVSRDTCGLYCIYFCMLFESVTNNNAVLLTKFSSKQSSMMNADICYKNILKMCDVYPK